DDGGGTDSGADASMMDGAMVVLPTCGPLPGAPVRTCEPAATDYSPGADDTWDACISDSGSYSRIEETISTIQRVAAFEQIVTLLADPTSENFLQARMLYQQEEGLDSRVVRRFDPRVNVPDGTDCTVDGVPAMFPEFCIGPSTIQPIILGAFAEGIENGGEVAAARVEAGILYFLYVSVFKEAVTCTTKAKDCDSAYAYWAGGEAVGGGIGLAADLQQADANAFDRTWDGILGMRCWRDLDSGDTATNLTLRDQAVDQIGRGMSDGLASLIRQRVSTYCGAPTEADWAFIQALGPALERDAAARDAAMGANYASALQSGDVDGMITALDALYPCP
ncbi:MAG: hypothetical protein AAF645_30165, partial [Myxococcota bacterium]